jgi:hypothetical protein
MKQSEFVTERLMALANEVRIDKRNARHALVEGSLLVDASEVAFRESRHMALQKKRPRVKFFDSHMRPEKTIEEKITDAAKLLQKRAVKKRVITKRA